MLTLSFRSQHPYTSFPTGNVCPGTPGRHYISSLPYEIMEVHFIIMLILYLVYESAL